MFSKNYWFLRLAVGALGISLLAGCGGMASKRDPSAVLKQAWTNFQLRDFDLAQAGFEKVRRLVPEKDPRQVEAIYGEASCWNLRQDGRDTNRARALFDEILRRDPSGPFAPWAVLDRVRSIQLTTGDEPPDEKELIKDYAAVERKFPGTPAATEALLYRADLEFPHATTSKELQAIESRLLDFV